MPLRVDAGCAYTRGEAKGGGCAQGVSVRVDFYGRAHGGEEGTHKGCALRDAGSRWWMRLAWAFCRAIASEFGCQNSRRRGAHTGGRAPTRGTPTVWHGGGHPQGVPLLGRGLRGVIRDAGSLRRFCRWWMRLAWAFCRAVASEFGRQNSRRRARARTHGGEGTHKGCPYGMLAA